MLHLIAEMFTYPFMVRALCMGVLVALCAAVLGVTLVLKRYSMIGDGLSHVGFGALAIATAMNAAPLAVAIPVVIIASFLLLRLTENSKIKGDAAIALISTGALAVGVMVVSMTTGMNTDVYNYLFGSILSMSQEDVVLTGVVSAAKGDRPQRKALQYGDRPSHSACHCCRDAYDGIAPDLEPGGIPGRDQYADVHNIPIGNDRFSDCFGGLPGGGTGHFLLICGSDRGQHRPLQYCGIHSLRSGAEGKGVLAK